jgi:hypothetical protein
MSAKRNAIVKRIEQASATIIPLEAAQLKERTDARKAQIVKYKAQRAAAMAELDKLPKDEG